MGLKPKKKKCSGCGHMKIIWSRGRCIDCARRQDTKPLNQSSIKRNTNGINKTSKKRDAVRQKDRLLYEAVWSEREHHCEECAALYGKGSRSFLGNQMEPFMFSHILTKAAHPKLRHVKDNINLLCLDHHHAWEFGERSSMQIFERNQRKILELLELERTL